MKYIILFFTFISLSVFAQDPNLELHGKNESGTLALGSDMNAQAPVCKKCQTRNLLLTQSKDKADSTSQNSSSTQPKNTNSDASGNQ